MVRVLQQYIKKKTKKGEKIPKVFNQKLARAKYNVYMLGVYKGYLVCVVYIFASVCVFVCVYERESNKFMRRIILCPFLILKKKKKRKKRGKRENLFPFERRENNK